MHVRDSQKHELGVFRAENGCAVQELRGKGFPWSLWQTDRLHPRSRPACVGCSVLQSSDHFSGNSGNGRKFDYPTSSQGIQANASCDDWPWHPPWQVWECTGCLERGSGVCPVLKYHQRFLWWANNSLVFICHLSNTLLLRNPLTVCTQRIIKEKFKFMEIWDHWWVCF